MNKERLYIEAYYARHINRNYDKAFIIFEEMSKTYPKDKLAHAELGWMFWRKEIYNKAIKELEIALELDPEYGLAYNYLVDTYIEKGDFNSALKICSLYASKCPWDALPFDRLGDFYLAEGKLDKAMTNYKEAVKIKPEFSSNYKIAYVYAFQENYVEALKWIDYYFNRARSFGKRGEGLQWKAFYHLWLGKLDQSLEELTVLAEMAKGVGGDIKADVDLWIGWNHYESGDFKQCQQCFNNWFDYFNEFSPGSSWVISFICFHQGLVDLKNGQIDSAKIRFDSMKDLLPEKSETDSDAWHRLLSWEKIMNMRYSITS